MDFDDAGRGREPEREGRVASVGALIGVAAAVVAGATIWLLLTDPVTVANAVSDGEITPLVRQLGLVILDALIAIFSYF